MSQDVEQQLDAIGLELPAARNVDLPAMAVVAPAAVSVLPVEPAGAKAFCTRCGARLQPDWSACPGCARRAQHLDAAAAALAAEPPYSVAPAIWLYFTLLGATVVGMICRFAGATEERVLVLLTLAHCLIVCTFGLSMRRDVIPALTRKFNPVWLLVGVGGAFVTFAIASGSVSFLRHLGGLQEIRMSDGLLRYGHGWGFVVLLSCVMPAVFEEIGFRGVVFSALARMLRPIETIVLSAFMFMVLHLMIASFPHLLLLGIILGFLRWRTGSILPGIVLHFTHNLLCVGAEWMSR